MQDREIVAAVAAGDPAGLAGAFDAYAAGLLRYCRSQLADRADAADAVQDTFIIAAARLSVLADTGRLRDWLQAVADGECQRRLRAGARPAPAAATTSLAVGTSEDGDDAAGLLPVLREQVLRLATASAPEETRYRDLVLSRSGRFTDSGFPALSGGARARRAARAAEGSSRARTSQDPPALPRRGPQPAALALAAVVVLLAAGAGTAVYLVHHSHRSPGSHRVAAAINPVPGQPGGPAAPASPGIAGTPATATPSPSASPTGSHRAASPGPTRAGSSDPSPSPTGPATPPPPAPLTVSPQTVQLTLDQITIPPGSPPVNIPPIYTDTSNPFQISDALNEAVTFTISEPAGETNYIAVSDPNVSSVSLANGGTFSDTVQPGQTLAITVFVVLEAGSSGAPYDITVSPGGTTVTLSL